MIYDFDCVSLFSFLPADGIFLFFLACLSLSITELYSLMYKQKISKVRVGKT